MDKAQALHSFWSSFEWDAIDEQSAYDTNTIEDLGDPDKYITYEVISANFGDPVTMTASLWHRSTSWATITQKADEIASAIGYGGKIVEVDDGRLWIKQGRPFAQRMAAEVGYDMRRIVLNIEVDFLTAT